MKNVNEIKFINMVDGQKYNVVDKDMDLDIENITIEKDGQNLIISFIGGDYADGDVKGLAIKFEINMDLIQSAYLYRIGSPLKYNTLDELDNLTIQEIYNVTNYMHEYILENAYRKNDKHILKVSEFHIK